MSTLCWAFSARVEHGPKLKETRLHCVARTYLQITGSLIHNSFLITSQVFYESFPVLDARVMWPSGAILITLSTQAVDLGTPRSSQSLFIWDVRSWIKQYVPYWHRQSEYLWWPGLPATDATMYDGDAEFYKNDLPSRNVPRLTSNVSREMWNERTDRWSTLQNVITFILPRGCSDQWGDLENHAGNHHLAFIIVNFCLFCSFFFKYQIKKEWHEVVLTVLDTNVRPKEIEGVGSKRELFCAPNTGKFLETLNLVPLH